MSMSAGTHSLNRVKMKKNNYIFVSILRKLQGCILCEEMSCSTPNSKYLPPVFGEYYQQKVFHSDLCRKATPIVRAAKIASIVYFIAGRPLANM